MILTVIILVKFQQSPHRHTNRPPSRIRLDSSGIDPLSSAYRTKHILPRNFFRKIFSKNYTKRRFLRPWNGPNSRVTWTSPRTALWDLTSLPRSLAGGEGNTPSPRSLP